MARATESADDLGNLAGLLLEHGVESDFDESQRLLLRALTGYRTQRKWEPFIAY
ncbi:MAG: hypothetical protein QOE61_2598 [Micromonosporaceae bacterium]|nr:hypothetical protein [Micromonosporaceae bacterium]